MKRKPHILIAGAGLGGLAAGLGLLRAGFDVDIYEQTRVLGEVGAGIQISSNGNSALFHLGLEAPARHWGVTAEDKLVRHWKTGQSWSIFERMGNSQANYTYPLLMLHRADLHAMLVEGVKAIKPDAIHLNKRTVDFEQRGDTVELVFEDGECASGDVLIGADGLHSRIRHQMFGPAVARFSGTIIWRCMVEASKLSAAQLRPVATNWLGPKAHVTTYPVRRSEIFNMGGQVDRDDWQVESWVAEGTRDECLADFPGWNDEVVDALGKSEKFYKWGIFVRDSLPAWNIGRVTLLGDSCHAMIPYLGQGANMALEDGVVLARCFEESKGDPDDALARYEKARLDRTTLVVNGSASMVGTNHSMRLADPVDSIKYIESQWEPGKAVARYDWIFNYDASSVPV